MRITANDIKRNLPAFAVRIESPSVFDITALGAQRINLTGSGFVKRQEVTAETLGKSFCSTHYAAIIL
jgi:hypothetical protein